MLLLLCDSESDSSDASDGINRIQDGPFNESHYLTSDLHSTPHNHTSSKMGNDAAAIAVTKSYL